MSGATLVIRRGEKMLVGNKDDRMEMPFECDYCGNDFDLKRYSHYGPGYQVEWLCPYCAVSFNKDDTLSKTMAAMLGVFEQRIKAV